MIAERFTDAFGIGTGRTEKVSLPELREIIAERTRHEFYSDDQERDDHGRWTNGGGGAASTKVESPKDSADLQRYVSDLKQTREYQAVSGRMDNLAKESPNVTEWSRKKNSDASGNYTPERQALHDKIVDATLNPKASTKSGEKPKFTMLIGAPGSGKTSAGVPVAKELGEHTYINPDDIKEKLPEYRGWNAGAMHEESKDVSEKQIMPRAIAARHNIMLDVTGANTEKAQTLVNEMGKKGYETHVVHVDAPSHVAAERVWSRYADKPQGRFVPMDFAVSEVDGRPSVTYEALKKNENVKSWTSIDNSGEKPKVRDRGKRVRKLTPAEEAVVGAK